MIIKYSNSAKKYIESLDSKTKRRIKQAIDGLPNGDIYK